MLSDFRSVKRPPQRPPVRTASVDKRGAHTHTHTHTQVKSFAWDEFSLLTFLIGRCRVRTSDDHVVCFLCRVESQISTQSFTSSAQTQKHPLRKSSNTQRSEVNDRTAA